jgi:hypothetical protein
MIYFAPTTSIVGLGENWIQTHGSVSRCAVDYVMSPFFSGVVALLNSVDDCVKGCYTLTKKGGELGFLFINKTLMRNLNKVNLHNSRSPNSPNAR